MTTGFTYLIIAVTLGVSLLSFSRPHWFEKMLMSPYRVIQNREYYRILTHGFLHGDYAHLFVNLFVLWSFGTALEDLYAYHFGMWGLPMYVLLYFGGMFVATLPALKKHSEDYSYRSVGASGAVSAVLFSYILIMPTSMLGLFLVIPIPAFVFGILYLWYEASMQNKRDGIAHDAHLFGALLGISLSIVYNPKWLPEFFLKVAHYVGSLF